MEAETGSDGLTCPSLTSLKQYLNPDCWLYMLSPLSVWAWTLPPPGEGAPADPEEEAVSRVGPSPETWNQEEDPAQKQEVPELKNGGRRGLLPSAPGGS